MKETSEAMIDIVLPWVDGSDPAWRALRNKYMGESEGDSSEERYRDWGLLKYVFRGIEKNLPWVRKVHFITCGHLPPWLDTSCSKLQIVKHEDYIPAQWLPTFSSHPIELNIHRISGLSEQFIYMNDDMFFVNPMAPSDFFRNGKPLSQAGMEVIHNDDLDYVGILYSDLGTINRHFDSKTVLRKTFFSFVNHRYPFRENYKTLLLAPWCVGFFPGFSFFHGPNAYLKGTFEEVWSKESERLSETCSHKFRTHLDNSQCTMMWWQWCSGSIVPSGIQKKLLFLSMDKPADYLNASIKGTSCPMLCVNDKKTDKVEEKMEAVIAAFETILGEKSQFER